VRTTRSYADGMEVLDGEISKIALRLGG
jgi:hypothetical protein